MKDYSKLSTKERKSVLILVADEIQKICEFGEDPKELDGSEKKLIKWIKEAHPELKPEELSGLSEEAVSVFVGLKLAKAEKPEKEEKSKSKKATPAVPEEDEDDLVELRKEVEACSKMKQLKHLVKMYDAFEGLRDGISSYTSVAALKKYMLSILDGELQVKKAKNKVTSNSTKDKATETANKASNPKKDSKSKNVINRQEAVLQTIKQKCKKAITMNQIAEFSNELYTKKNKDIKGISKIQNMMNVVRHSVLALQEFEILECKDAKYKLI